MIIAVDFDDTIVDVVPALLARLNRLENLASFDAKAWSPSDITKWEMSEITGFTKETILEEWGKIDYFEEVSREWSAISTLRQWVDEYGYDVEIVTANPDEQMIREWLDFNGLGVIPLTSTPDKVSYLTYEGFDFIVDDNPHTVLSASGVGIKSIVYHKPWNSYINHDEHDSLYRAFTWIEVDRVVRRFAQAEMVKKIDEVQKSIEETPTVTNFERALRDAGFSNVVLTEEAKKYYGEVLDDDLSERHAGQVPTPIEEWAAGPPDDIETNENGAKQSKIYGRFDLLPMRALWSVARVLQEGEAKYGKDNWRGLSIDEINNHVWGHLADWQLTGNMEDLEHAATRILMALEIARGGGNVGTEHDED